MERIINGLKQKAAEAEKSSRLLFKRLRKNPPKDLDTNFQSLHAEVFSRIDCMECASCCASLGPRITDRDIERISKILKMRLSQFTVEYLVLDEEGDYIFSRMPCPFLLNDNSCEIYDHRPKACKEYPHTDRKKIIQLLDLMLKNSYTCPAVYEIIEDASKNVLK